MKQQKLLLALVIMITFIGGFLSGILYSSNREKDEPRQLYIEQVKEIEELHVGNWA